MGNLCISQLFVVTSTNSKTILINATNQHNKSQKYFLTAKFNAQGQLIASRQCAMHLINLPLFHKP